MYKDSHSENFNCTMRSSTHTAPTLLMQTTTTFSCLWSLWQWRDEDQPLEVLKCLCADISLKFSWWR